MSVSKELYYREWKRILDRVLLLCRNR